MSNWTVRQRIICGLSAIILVMVALGLFAFIRLTLIKAKATLIGTDGLPALSLLGEIKSAATESYVLVHQYILLQDQEEKRQQESELQANVAKTDDLIKRYTPTIIHDEDHRLLSAITTARGLYLAAYEDLRKISRANDPGAAKVALQERLSPLYKSYSDAIDAALDFNKQSADESVKDIYDAIASTETSILLGLGAGFIFALVSGYLLVQAINQPLARVVAAMEVMRTGDFSRRLPQARDDEFGVLAEGLNRMADDLTTVIGQVQRSSLQVNTSSTEIAATAKQQEVTSSEIAATTSEIGATAKEIAATSKELAKAMSEVMEVAEKTVALAGSGQTSLTRMETTIQQVMEAAASITARLAVLNEKAANINTVVTTITKVADQTNLLSLNAAIEAEKAGEYGRGFAVVATEIRRLADQTAVATYDIEQMVKEMQSAVSAGVMGMDTFAEELRRGGGVISQASEHLLQIIQQVQTLTPSFETVNAGMQSQSAGAQQISESLVQLSEAARQTLESLRQSNLAIEQLNGTARGLQSGVARFTLQA